MTKRAAPTAGAAGSGPHLAKLESNLGKASNLVFAYGHAVTTLRDMAGKLDSPSFRSSPEACSDLGLQLEWLAGIFRRQNNELSTAVANAAEVRAALADYLGAAVLHSPKGGAE